MAEAGGEPGHEVVEAVPDTLGIELRPDGVGQAEGGTGNTPGPGKKAAEDSSDPRDEGTGGSEHIDLD
nr:hypothetical protein [Streptomyces sp. SID7834]